MRDHLLLCINGKPVRVTGDDAFVTLAEFLRRRQRLTGTKIVCAEGDCGACAVLVGRPMPDGQSIEYSSVNSCIQLMFQLDATHVVTVEGLKYGDELNPIQKSMVACQGTQCGFCTPGFVVSLYDLMHDNGDVTPHKVRRALVGNLCRCTGYDSIIRAAIETDRTDLKSLNVLYPPGEILSHLAPGEEVEIKSNGSHFFKPANLTTATKFLSHHNHCLILSGATDLGVQCNKGIRKIATVLSTAAIPHFRDIEARDRELIIGAGATLTQLEYFTAAHLPELSNFLALFGSPLIKNAATLAGNLVNASPIGDTIPALFVLGGEVELMSLTTTRWIKIEDFYTGYRKTVLAPGEIVSRIRLPLPDPSDIFKLYKVSRRKDLDISTFGAAILMRRTNGTIDEIRIALGGVASTVVRLPRTEAFLTGKPIAESIFEQAGEIATSEIAPISDVRGSSNYRVALASNILHRFWHEIEGRGAEANAFPGAGK